MGNHWAVSIGINQYQHFQPLSYAQNAFKPIWLMKLKYHRFTAY